METKEVLIAARGLIKKGWIQGVDSQVRNGVTCYCAVGAVHSVLPGIYQTEPLEALRGALSVHDKARGGVMSFNDAEGRTQAEVLALFDRAIERAA